MEVPRQVLHGVQLPEVRLPTNTGRWRAIEVVPSHVLLEGLLVVALDLSLQLRIADDEEPSALLVTRIRRRHPRLEYRLTSASGIASGFRRRIARIESMISKRPGSGASTRQASGLGSTPRYSPDSCVPAQYR